MPWAWQTGDIVGSDPASMKHWRRATFDWNAPNGTIVITFYLDGVANPTTLTLPQTNSRTRQQFWVPPGLRGRRLSLAMQGSLGSVLYPSDLDGVEGAA